MTSGIPEFPAQTLAVQGEDMLQPDEVAAMVRLHELGWVRIPGSSRAPFRIDGAQDSETIARSVPRIIRAAFRDDRAQFGMT